MHSFSGSNKQLELAFKQMSSSWFPVNPEVLSKVRSRIISDFYRKKPSTLVEDLKSDFSLYFYCFREMRALLDSPDRQNSSKSPKDTPSQSQFSNILEHARISDLRQILSTSVNDISSYRIDSISDAQASRIRDSMLSASTAEILAEKMGLPAQMGFNCALLRQLGLTLIAWNYPHVYQQALQQLAATEQSSANDIDVLLHNTLGFSPSMLGIRFAESWNLDENILQTLSTTCPKNLDTSPAKERNGKWSNTLAHICAVGESLARANNPQEYPSSRSDWEGANRVLRHHLGPNGAKTVYKRTCELMRYYYDRIPNVKAFDPKKLQSPGQIQIRDTYAQALLDRNVYVKACPSAVQNKLASLYSKVKANQVSDDLVRLLLREIAPSLGFGCSCVFMLDPTSVALMPVLKVGTPSFVRLKVISLMTSNSGHNPVRMAFARKKPFSETGIVKDGSKKTFIAGTIGEQKAVGVLYLEINQDAPSEVKKHPTVIFNAFTTCLNDLLHIT